METVKTIDFYLIHEINKKFSCGLITNDTCHYRILSRSLSLMIETCQRVSFLIK